MVVVYEETGQITTTLPHTGCVASSDSPCPLSATSMEQGHSTQSSFAVTGGLWLEMGRRKKAWIPVMSTPPPTPVAIIQLVKCKCTKERCANNHCKCRKAGLTCTDLSGCSDTKEDCKNKLVDVNDDGCNDEDDVMMMLMKTRVNMNIFQTLMALRENFLSTQLNKLL